MSTNEGVVDPIRIPESARRLWRTTPVLVRVFVALALLDAVARTLGLVDPPVDLSLSRPLSLVASFLPRDLLILFPAIIVARLPTARQRTPWVLGGAMVISVAELVGRPLGSLLALDLLGSAIVIILPAAGWLAIGWGLRLLNPKVPPLPVAGTANLVALIVVLASLIVAVLPLVVRPAIDLGDPVSTDTVVAFGAFGVLGSLPWAYLLRAVVRGFGDPRRSSRATSAGTLAALLSAILSLGTAILTVIARVDVEIVRPFAQSPIYVPLFWLGTGGAVSLLVVAFALGLSDPDRRVGGMPID